MIATEIWRLTIWFFFILSVVDTQTRLMNQKKFITNQSSSSLEPVALRLYKGSIDCGIQTVRNEGFSALYKGFVPTWVRMGPWNIIFFITYEQLKQMHWIARQLHLLMELIIWCGIILLFTYKTRSDLIFDQNWSLCQLCVLLCWNKKEGFIIF